MHGQNNIRFENAEVFIREKVRLENSPSQTFSLINTPTFYKPSHSSYLPAYKDGTECSETSVYKIQTPGNYPEESTQHQNKTKVWNQKSSCSVLNNFKGNCSYRPAVTRRVTLLWVGTDTCFEIHLCGFMNVWQADPDRETLFKLTSLRTLLQHTWESQR